MTSGLSRQCLVVIGVALKGLRWRWWPALNTVIGTASVIGVLVVLLSIAAGYEKALRMSGSADMVIVMRAGARSELESSLSGEQARLVRDVPGLTKDGQGQPLAAAEVYAIASIAKGGDYHNLAVRGVESASYSLRPRWQLVAGRRPQSGMRELVVGRRAQQHYRDLTLGAQVPIADADWTLVGVFEADGGVVESELWTDAATLQTAYQRGDTVQVVYAQLQPGTDVDSLNSTLARDPRLKVSVETEADYYGKQSRQMTGFVKTLGFSVALLMGLAAVFAALNAGYAATSARNREMATLIALGLDERAIIASVLVESVIMALLGGVCGSAIAYGLYDGHVASTLFYSRDFAQVVFAFNVSAEVLAQAVAGAVLTGVFGGLWPALQITRLPIAQALTIRT